MQATRRAAHWLTILLFVCASSRGASAATADVLTGYSIASWTETDAGPLGAVSAIVQDADGYLWVGTSAGLFRFDGTRFTHWDAFGERPLPASPVSALRIARDGSLWVGLANRAGVARVSGRTFDLIEAGPLRVVMSLVEDQGGTIWAASDPSLYRLNGRAWERVPVRSATGEVRVVNSGVLSDGTLWAGAPTGLFLTRDGGRSFTQGADRWVWSASQDASGAVWLTDTVTGFRRQSDVIDPAAPIEGNGYRVLHDSQGNIWVATIGEGLWRVRTNGAPAQIEKAMLASAVFSDSVQSLVEDREANLWVGTTVGLHRLTRQQLTPLTNIGLVTAADATSNALWAGTNYGVVRFTRTAGEWVGRRIAGPTIYVNAMHRDRAGSLWVGAVEGLFEATDRGLRRVGIPREHGMTAVTCVSSDSGGALWLTDGSRVLHWDRHQFTTLQLPAASPAGRPVCVHNDARDRLWIGFPDARLLLRDTDGTYRQLGPETLGTDANAIYNVSETRDGAVWVATNAGVTRYKDGRAVTFTRARGLPADRVWTVVDDDRQYVWLSLDVGVVRIHPGEFDKAASDAAYRLRFDSFDAADGLAGAAILRVRAGGAPGGTVWFVRGGALTVGDTDVIAGWRRPAHGPARIERVATEDRTIEATPSYALPSATKRLEVDYTAIALTHPGRVRFRYRLDGFDTDWIQASSRRTAVYTNLPPRVYRFVVQAGTDHDGWHEAPAVWEFSIQPAFHQTAWFYSVVVVAAGLVVWGTWRFRVGLVRREYAAVLAERTRLSREIHDTLLQGVVGVALQLDAIAHRVGAASADARDALVRLRRQVEAYIREARQSILDLRSPLLDARTLPDVLRQIGQDATADTAVRFTLAVSGRVRRFAPRLENELLRIAQEAITNAVRHARARRITLELNYGADAVALTVTDDGCGIGPELHHPAVDDHYGLVIMRERAEHLGGRLHVVPLPQGGTKIEAVLPAGAAA